ncbi:hypothetical protein OROMI_026477 [Orobanche minor]
MASHFRAETITLEGSYKDLFFQLLSQLFFIWSNAPFKACDSSTRHRRRVNPQAIESEG